MFRFTHWFHPSLTADIICGWGASSWGWLPFLPAHQLPGRKRLVGGPLNRPEASQSRTSKELDFSLPSGRWSDVMWQSEVRSRGETMRSRASNWIPHQNVELGKKNIGPDFFFLNHDLHWQWMVIYKFKMHYITLYYSWNSVSTDGSWQMHAFQNIPTVLRNENRPRN